MYVEGFVVAVPKENKEKYVKQATEAADMFKKLGATRVVECWQSDVPHGKKTDFFGAVQAKENEEILFSWIEYPDKNTRDKATESMMKDPRMEEWSKAMPFDGSRMIFGGFESILDVH
jgi:uncharacterized protein YbaA (DUF1428 family)